MHVYGEIEGTLAPAARMSGNLARESQLDGELTIPARIASAGIYAIHVAYNEAWSLVDTTYEDIVDAYNEEKELRLVDDTNVIVAYFSKVESGAFYFSAVDGSSGSAYIVIEYSISDEEVLAHLYENTETDPTVPSWAKQQNKPTYTAQEVGALPDSTQIPSKVSDLQNDSGFLTAETDPTVPSWAKQPNKPTYTAQEVGALPDSTQIPSKVSDLQNDSGFLTAETDPTVPSWAKQPNKPTYTASEVGALPDDTPIPSKLSDLTNDMDVSDFNNDAGYLTLSTLPIYNGGVS